MRRSYHVLALAPALVLGAACGGGDDNGTNPSQVPTTITVSSPSSDSLVSIGQTLQLGVVVRDQNNAIIQSPSVAWTSTANAIATVGSTGLVTVAGAGPGSAYIRATAGAVKDSFKVNVRQRFHHVAVTPSSRTLAPTATVQLTATPQDAGNNNMTGLPAATWTSSNTTVAEVSGTGLVTAKANGGPVTITATIVSAADGSKQGTAAITVGTTVVNADVTASSTANLFTPQSVTVSPGGTVTWHFGTLAHSVVFDGAPGGAPAPPANIGATTNANVSRTFSSAIAARTTYTYECGLHPGMTGSVVVQP